MKPLRLAALHAASDQFAGNGSAVARVSRSKPYLRRRLPWHDYNLYRIDIVAGSRYLFL